MTPTMTPSRAYLLRALNEWILDNECTPYVVVDAEGEGVDVPQAFVKDGQIVLNINPVAVRNLFIGNEALSFEARFSGQSMQVFVPMDSVMAVYAKENGQGMVFGWEQQHSELTDEPDNESAAGLSEVPGLLSEDDNPVGIDDSDDGDDDPTPPRPKLRVVK